MYVWMCVSICARVCVDLRRPRGTIRIIVNAIRGKWNGGARHVGAGKGNIPSANAVGAGDVCIPYVIVSGGVHVLAIQLLGLESPAKIEELTLLRPIHGNL